MSLQEAVLQEDQGTVKMATSQSIWRLGTCGFCLTGFGAEVGDAQGLIRVLVFVHSDLSVFSHLRAFSSFAK